MRGLPRLCDAARAGRGVRAGEGEVGPVHMLDVPRRGIGRTDVFYKVGKIHLW